MVLYRFKNTEIPKDDIGREQDNKHNTENTKRTPKKTAHGIDHKTRRVLDTKIGNENLELICVVAAIVISIFMFSFIGYGLITIISEDTESKTSVSSVVETAHDTDTKSYSDGYSVFYGTQDKDTKMPDRWEVTVDETHKNVNFGELRHVMNVSAFESFTCYVYDKSDCIASNLAVDDIVGSNWNAYDLCNDSGTKTYNLTVKVYEYNILSGNETEYGTVSLKLTVVK